jgi:hypothetical protein
MNNLDLKGRVAVITGGAQGIGYATSERMLRSGASVVMWDIDAGKLEEAKASLGKLGKVSGYVVELTSDAAVGATTAQTIKDSGHIDILVNNAGITGGNGTTWDLDPEVWEACHRCEFDGALLHLSPHHTAYGVTRMGSHCEYRLCRWKRRQPQRQPLQRIESRRDCVDQITGQRSRDKRCVGQCGSTRRRQDSHVCHHGANPYRLHAQQNPNGAFCRSR